MTLKKAFSALLFLSLVPPLSAAGFDTGLAAFRAGLEAAPEPPAAAALKAAPAEWTLMVFINGKNNLSEYGEADLNEMEQVGSNSRMNVVVELGRLNRGVNRHYVKKDRDDKTVTSPVVKALGSPDMGDWKELADFALWAKAAYPAKRYMLVVWNHGSGWVSDKPANKGISYDDETRNHISTPELRQAMEKIGRVDILAMDACLMQMAEVAYEVRAHAELIVASEETVPGYGYPYAEILGSFSRLSAAPSETLAAKMVEQFNAYYNKLGSKATHSAVRTAALPGLARLLDSWAEAALAFPDKEKLRAAGNDSAEYAIDEYKDLADFIARASVKTGDPLLAERGDAVLAHLKGKVLVANAATAQMPAGSNGLSIYVSRDGAGPRYKALAFAADTRWDDFLVSLPRYYPPVHGGCQDPGPFASLEEVQAYIDCLSGFGK